MLKPMVMATASAPAEAANHREAAGDFNVIDMAFPFYEPDGVTRPPGFMAPRVRQKLTRNSDHRRCLETVL